MLLAVAAATAACSSYRIAEEPFVAEDCVLVDDSSCERACEEDDCPLLCDGVEECDRSCGDDCDYACARSGECALDCGAGCTATCEDATSCEIDCGEDCNVLCARVTECRVAMVSGIVICESDSVTDCAITCATTLGEEAALDCGDGLFACGACP